MQQCINIGGYSEMTIEIFYDSLVELLDKLPTLSEQELYQELTEENATSDYCTWYLRALTATQLKADPDRFLPYVMGESSSSTSTFYADIASFCQGEIDPMGKECGQVQVLALAEYFRVALDIHYLDGRAFSDNKLTCHSFGSTSNNSSDGTASSSPIQLALLYRPGHYDIIYPSES